MKNKVLLIFLFLLLLMTEGCLIDDECLDPDVVAKFEEERGNSYENDDNKNEKSFIDLGLPSGTKWCDRNLGGTTLGGGTFLTWKDAKYQIPKGMVIPTEKQFRELINTCTWRWIPEEYRFSCTGPNGNSIFFSAGGLYGNQSNMLSFKNQIGYFWTMYDDDIQNSYEAVRAPALRIKYDERIPNVESIGTFLRVNTRCVKQ